MCLLIVSYKTFPKREILQAGEKHNPDGAGIAWIEGEDPKTAVVKWKKGLKARELQQFADKKGPFLIHFRRATVGKNIPELNHPFEFSASASTELEGETKSGVLAHNGCWSDWHKNLIELINSNNKLPDGPWSDSRALAWYAHNKGHEILEGLSVGDKIAILTPKGVMRYGNWGLVDKEAGLCCSYNPYYSYSTIVSGSWDEYGRLYDRGNYYRNKSVTANAHKYTIDEYRNYDEYIETLIANNPKLKPKYQEAVDKLEKKPEPKIIIGT